MVSIIDSERSRRAYKLFVFSLSFGLNWPVTSSLKVVMVLELTESVLTFYENSADLVFIKLSIA